MNAEKAIAGGRTRMRVTLVALTRWIASAFSILQVFVWIGALNRMQTPTYLSISPRSHPRSVLEERGGNRFWSHRLAGAARQATDWFSTTRAARAVRATAFALTVVARPRMEQRGLMSTMP